MVDHSSELGGGGSWRSQAPRRLERIGGLDAFLQRVVEVIG
jgi:hypothetical protein